MFGVFRVFCGQILALFCGQIPAVLGAQILGGQILGGQILGGQILGDSAGGEYVSIPLAGSERLLRSIGSQVPQDCSAEGPRESQEGS